MSARQQTVAFSTAIDDLKKRLTSMNEVNQRLRIMLGIETPKSGDQVNGRGGEETPLPEGSNIIQIDKNQRTGDTTSQSSLTTQESVINSEQSEAIDEEKLVAEVKEGIDWLKKEADTQEKTLQELYAVAEQKSSRWAATPSIWPVKG